MKDTSEDYSSRSLNVEAYVRSSITNDRGPTVTLNVSVDQASADGDPGIARYSNNDSEEKNGKVLRWETRGGIRVWEILHRQRSAEWRSKYRSYAPVNARDIARDPVPYALVRLKTGEAASVFLVSCTITEYG